MSVFKRTFSEYKTRFDFNTPAKIAEYLFNRISDCLNEIFGVMFLDEEHQPTGLSIVFQGPLERCFLQPRDILIPAALMKTPAMVLFHVEPNGNPEPSKAELIVTRNMAEAAAALGIEILDHIVMNGKTGSFFSLMRRNQY
jgi:DNA repair protein RadC